MLAGYSLQTEGMLFLEEKEQLHLCQELTYALRENYIVEAMCSFVKVHQGQSRPMQG